MTHVSNMTRTSSLFNASELKEYQVEVITFDGDSEIVYVEAYTDEEAMDKAAREVPNADYCMIQSVWAA